jgi:hypothetical protein
VPHYSRQILEFGRYGEALFRYLNYFPPGQILVMTDQQMRDHVSSYESACRFLGVAQRPPPRDLFQGVNVGVYAPQVLWMLNRLAAYQYSYDFRYGRLHVKGDLLSKAAQFASCGVATVGTWLVGRLEATQAMKVKRELRLRLLDYYRADIESLERLLGMSLPSWKSVRDPVDDTLQRSYSTPHPSLSMLPASERDASPSA